MGAILFITGRNKIRLNETFNLLQQNENCNHKQCLADLTNDDDMSELVSKLPVLNGFVHCAGIVKYLPFQFVKEDFTNNLFNINFFSGLTLSTRIIKTKKIDKNSSIVFVSSITGVLGSFVGGAVYAASKGALSGLVKGMAVDLASKKIRVNSVCPAMVETNLLDDTPIMEDQLEIDKQKYPLKRYAKPEEVAFAAIYLLSEASNWTTGTNLLLDGGLTISF
jgi:NAD(P)-dependent dehydrogenase (short-subunit alcohol dehydrogenase family)